MGMVIRMSASALKHNVHRCSKTNPTCDRRWDLLGFRFRIPVHFDCVYRANGQRKPDDRKINTVFAV